jgi:hypothetical protein
MDHFPRPQEGEEERKERPKEEIGHLQEVARPDVRRVVVQKGVPSLSWWLVCANRPHVLLNGSLAEAKAKFQQFSTNALITEDGDSLSPSSLSRRPFL